MRPRYARGRRSAEVEDPITHEGIAALSSSYGPKETMDKLAAAVMKHGMAVLARSTPRPRRKSDWSCARGSGFGNPTAGTPLMQAVQTVGIDLRLTGIPLAKLCLRRWLPRSRAPEGGNGPTSPESGEQFIPRR